MISPSLYGRELFDLIRRHLIHADLHVGDTLAPVRHQLFGDLGRFAAQGLERQPFVTGRQIVPPGMGVRVGRNTHSRAS